MTALALAGAAVLATGTFAAIAAPSSGGAATAAVAAASGDDVAPTAPTAAAERGEKDDEWCEGNGGDNESRNRRNSKHCRDEDGGETRGAEKPPQQQDGDDDRHRGTFVDACARTNARSSVCAQIVAPKVPLPNVHVTVERIVDDVCARSVTHPVTVRGYELPPNRVELRVIGHEVAVGYDRDLCANVGR